MASAATHVWTDEETRFMLTQVQELNILKFMDGRKTRNADLFKKIAKINRGQPDVALCWEGYSATWRNWVSHAPASYPILWTACKLKTRDPVLRKSLSDTIRNSNFLLHVNVLSVYQPAILSCVMCFCIFWFFLNWSFFCLHFHIGCVVLWITNIYASYGFMMVTI